MRLFGKPPPPPLPVEVIAELVELRDGFARMRGHVLRIQAAYDAGVRYHNAVTDMRKALGHGGVVTVEDEDKLEELFALWHDAIAAAIGVPP
jgi:hypothetical protein